MESSSPKILDTKFSIRWLEKTLQNYFETHSGANITGWNCRKIGENQGFQSNLIQVSLKWSEGTPEKFPESVVLKVPITKWAEDTAAGEAARTVEGRNMIIKLHQLECSFYELWSQEAAPFKIPRCFSMRMIGECDTDEPGYLLMEDLCINGMVPDTTHILTLPQCLSVMENFAKLHAWCFETKVDFQSILPTPAPESTKSLVDLVRGLLIDLKSQWVDYFQDRIDILLDRYLSFWQSAHNEYKNLGIQPVICHGDFAIVNVFFTKEKDGSIGSTVASIIDWQGAFTGTLTQDLACVLYACVDPEMRIRDLHIILEHYYRSLIENLSSENPPFSFEKLLEAYHCLEKFGLIFQFAMIATLGTNEEHKKTKQEGLMKLFERGRENFDDFLVAESQN